VLYLELPGSQTRAEDRAALEPWAGAFYRAVARAFLGSYREEVRGAEWFPEDSDDDLRVRLDIHLLEKALYELIYELNHRPDWACLPLRALLEFTEGADRAPRAGVLASPGRQRSESGPKPGN
jgi:maltose alpha-D-glucosyltransferase/alpha-amylase